MRNYLNRNVMFGAIFVFTEIVSSHFMPFEFTKVINGGSIMVWQNICNEFGIVRNSSENSSKYTDYPDPRGKPILLSVPTMLPHIKFDPYSEPKVSGYIGEIWLVIEATMGFNVTYVSEALVGWSTEMDISLSPSILNDLVTFDHSSSLGREWYTLFMKQTAGYVADDSYFRTFSLSLWGTAILFLMLLVLALWVTTKTLVPNTPCDTSVGVYVLAGLSGFCNQGSELNLLTVTGKFLSVIALLLGYVLYSSLSAVLMSLLTVEHSSMPITTLNQAATMRTHSLCLRTDNFVYNSMDEFIMLISENGSSGTEELYPKWQGVANGPGCININNSTNIPKVICKDGIIVFEMVPIITNLLATKSIPCSIMQSPVKYYSSSSVLVIKKGFPYLKQMNNLLLQMRSVGIMTRFERLWMQPRDFDSHKRTFTIIEMSHVALLLKLYYTSIGICVIILLLEIVYFKYTYRIPYVE